MNREFDPELGDSLDDLLDPNAPRRAMPIVPVAAPADYQQPTAVEPCAKCAGTGMFRGWSGRSAGRCFKCRGTGKLQFKTTAARRAANAESRQRQVVSALETFQRDYAAEWSWLQAQTGRFEFATKMHEIVSRGRSLTDGQLAAVRRCLARDEARTAERNAERAAREAAAPVIDMAKITEAFARAARILKYPRLRVAGLVFGLPSAESAARAEGVVYVRSEERVYLGKIAGGRFVRSRECTAEQEAAVLAAAVDPQEAAIRYGRLTGNCAACGRLLSAEDSLGRGIGPVCAERFGW